MTIGLQLALANADAAVRHRDQLVVATNGFVRNTTAAATGTGTTAVDGKDA